MTDERIRAVHEMLAAFRALGRRPILALTLLSVFLAVAGTGIFHLLGPQTDDPDLLLVSLSTVFFAVAGIYLQISIILAAASSGEAHGPDPWIKAALKHRCFWRYVGAILFAGLFVALGALALLVGAIVVGGIVGLAEPAVVLERKGAADALGRSAELTKPVRPQVALIFGVLWLPPLVYSVLESALEIRLELPADVALAVAGAVLPAAGVIAMTNVFVKLGGAPTPPLQTLLYKAKADSPP
jgi:hypothetical protein